MAAARALGCALPDLVDLGFAPVRKFVSNSIFDAGRRLPMLHDTAAIAAQRDDTFQKDYTVITESEQEVDLPFFASLGAIAAVVNMRRL